jgi:putative ABC transport system permease protein
VRLLRWLPWEALPLGAAAVLFALVLGGHGLAHDVNGASHPRLAVFLVPIVAVVGVAGLAVRAGRSLLARRGGDAPPVVFLALRRIGAARGLLVAVIVSAATAFGTFAYAATLSASLDRSTAEKAYVSNGSDVQGLVDPTNTIVTPFPFPVALVEVDQSNMSFPSGERVDVVAGDPAQLARTLRWGPWSDDPRRLLPRVTGPGLAAIASPGAPATDAIFDQGVRLPVRVVGHAPIPGSTAGRPALLVSLAAFRRATARAHVIEPGPQASGFLWAKGDPARLLPVLERSDVAPSYLTTLDHIEQNASVAAAERSYRYVRIIGVAAAVLALVALLLYLHARQRGQLIASALVRRMGVSAAADAAALALEAAAVVAFAALVGGAAATAAARPIAHRVDSLPQYAPPPVFTVPWATLLVGGACAIAAAALLGVVAAVLAGRSDVAEALRVA